MTIVWKKKVMNLHEHDSFWNREKGIKKLPSTFFSQVHQFPSIYFTMQRHEWEFSSLECGNFDKMLPLPHRRSGKHLGTMHGPLNVAKTVRFDQVSFFFINNETSYDLRQSNCIDKGDACASRYYGWGTQPCTTRSGSNLRSSTGKPMLLRLSIP